MNHANAKIIRRQDAFTETYLTTQRSHIFTSVGVLIYVFDVESRSFSSFDLNTYTQVIRALAEFSPEAKVFALLHKMDLVQMGLRERVVRERGEVVIGVGKEGGFGVKKGEGVRVYGTSIWDQSLYQAVSLNALGCLFLLEGLAC